MFASLMRKKAAAKRIAAAWRALQPNNARKLAGIGTNAALHAQERAQKYAFKFACHNANAEELPDLDAHMDSDAS